MLSNFNKKYFGLIYINNGFIISPLFLNRHDTAAYIDDFLKDKLDSNALFNIFSFSTFEEKKYYIMLNKKTFLNGDLLLISEEEYSLIKNDIELENLIIISIPENTKKIKFNQKDIQNKYDRHLKSELLDYVDIYFGIIENNNQTNFVGFSYDLLKTIQSIDEFINQKENYKITLMHTREKFSENHNYYLIITGNKQLIFSHPEVINNFENKGYQFYKVFCDNQKFENSVLNFNNYKELIKNFRYNSINLLSVNSGESHEIFMHKLGIDKINEMLPIQNFPDISNIISLIYDKNDIEILISNSANDEYQTFGKHNSSFISHYISALIFSTNNQINLKIECAIPTPFFQKDKKEYMYSIIQFENGHYKKINKEQIKYHKHLLFDNNKHYTIVDSQRFLDLIKK